MKASDPVRLAVRRSIAAVKNMVVRHPITDMPNPATQLHVVVYVLVGNVIVGHGTAYSAADLGAVAAGEATGWSLPGANDNLIWVRNDSIFEAQYIITIDY